uniref:Aquaporin 7 n=1 Tax=Pan paniscus TaxID=9597 RepID=A0A2R8ZDB1_PANPA
MFVVRASNSAPPPGSQWLRSERPQQGQGEEAVRREGSGGRGSGRGSLRQCQGGPGHGAEELELSSEPSSEVGIFGLGSVAHMVLNKTYGSYLGVNLGFGFGVTMGVHVAGRISGAHMNAAVTFTNCALGRFPVYVLGQFLGSFLVAATIYSLFYTAILHFSGGELMVTGPVATAGIFATYLPDHMTLWRGFLNEAWLTGMLQLCLFAITDQENNPALPGTEALVIGILVVIIGVSLGMNTGYVFRYCPCPGGIIYLVFIGSTIPREPLKLEDSVAYEDHGITVLPKMGSHEPTISPLTPVSVSPANRSSVHPAPPLHESMALEHF